MEDGHQFARASHQALAVWRRHETVSRAREQREPQTALQFGQRLRHRRYRHMRDFCYLRQVSVGIDRHDEMHVPRFQVDLKVPVEL